MDGPVVWSSAIVLWATQDNGRHQIGKQTYFPGTGVGRSATTAGKIGWLRPGLRHYLTNTSSGLDNGVFLDHSLSSIISASYSAIPKQSVNMPYRKFPSLIIHLPRSDQAKGALSTYTVTRP